LAIEFLCRKIGMTRFFDEQGQCVSVTVLDAGPNAVVQKKTAAKDGYTALQLGAVDRSRKNVTKAVQKHFEKAGVAPKRMLAESRVSEEDAATYEVGQELTLELFSAGQRVDAIGTSKGRGMTGVVKRHNFPVHTEGHGTHEFFRHGGSIGANSYPGRVIKGLRMAGRYGGERVTTRNLVVLKVDVEKKLIFVRGAVPGHNRGFVRIRSAVSSRKGA
jgi:large subunit ribosomal protein L3